MNSTMEEAEEVRLRDPNTGEEIVLNSPITTAESMNQFLGLFHAKADAAKVTINSSVFDSPLTKSELDSTVPKKNALLYPHLLAANGEIRARREKGRETLRNKEGVFLTDLTEEDFTAATLRKKALRCRERQRAAGAQALLFEKAAEELDEGKEFKLESNIPDSRVQFEN